MTDIVVIGDLQVKPDQDISHIIDIGKYIKKVKPDVVVNIGDFYDFPSLCKYDKNTLDAEGRRLAEDITAGNIALTTLDLAMQGYKGRKVFTKGNHEYRLQRMINENPELAGLLVEDMEDHITNLGWELYDFLQPVEICGIMFVHYVQNNFSGKPLGGTALNILKQCGVSYVMGHKQVLDIAIRPTMDKRMQIGIVNGASYPHDEKYKGYQGNTHFRGIIHLKNAGDGFADIETISLDRLKS